MDKMWVYKAVLKYTENPEKVKPLTLFFNYQQKRACKINRSFIFNNTLFFIIHSMLQN